MCGNRGGQDLWGRAVILERNGRVGLQLVLSTDTVISSFAIRWWLVWMRLLLSHTLLPPRLLGELVGRCGCHAHFIPRGHFDFFCFLLPGGQLLPLLLPLLVALFLPPPTSHFRLPLCLLVKLFLIPSLAGNVC